MKLNKEVLMNGDTYRKICGKVSNFKLRRTIGFVAEDIVDIDEITYFFGFKIRKKQMYNIRVTNPTMLEAIKKYSINELPESDRTIVKGYSCSK